MDIYITRWVGLAWDWAGAGDSNVVRKGLVSVGTSTKGGTWHSLCSGQ